MFEQIFAGTTANDGTGTNARVAAGMLNSNFGKLSDVLHSAGIKFGYRSAELPPSINAVDWSTVARPVWDYTHLKHGDRFSPQMIREIAPNFYLCLYNGNQEAEMVGFNTSLAFSHGLTDWVDYGPILSRYVPGVPNVYQPWEGVRVRGRHFTFDKERQEWVLFYDSNGSAANSPDGITIRATGLAFSKDLKTWTKHANNPIFWASVADLPDWRPSNTDMMATQFVIYKDGVYYAFISTGNRSARNYRYGILTATNPEGPWSGGAHNPIYDPSVGTHWHGGFAFPMDPTFCVSEQRWYMPIHSQTGGVGFMRSAGPSPLGPWTDVGHKVIQVPRGADSLHVNIIPLSGGTYACIAMQPKEGAGSTGADHEATTVLMTSHIEPTLLVSLGDVINSKLDATTKFVRTVDKASQLDATQGTNHTKWMTPLRVRQALDVYDPDGPPAAFDPYTLDGLVLDLDATKEAALRSLSSGFIDIGQWSDAAGSSAHYTQGAENLRPTLTQVNGRWVVASNGTRFLEGTLAARELLKNLAGITIFVVHYNVSTAGQQAAISWSTTTATALRLTMFRNRTTGATEVSGRRNNSDNNVQVKSDNNVHTANVLGVDCAALNYTGGIARLFFNNNQVAVNNSFQGQGMLHDSTPDNSRIFSGSGTGAIVNGMNGGIRSILFYNRLLTDEERGNVNAFLMSRDGIT